MAKRINVKLIMELSAGGLTQNEIASSRHFSKTSVNLVLKTARELNVSAADLREMSPEEAYRLFFPEKLSADQIYELPDYGYVMKNSRKSASHASSYGRSTEKSALPKATSRSGKQSSVTTTTSIALKRRSAATSSINRGSVAKWTGAAQQ